MQENITLITQTLNSRGARDILKTQFKQLKRHLVIQATYANFRLLF